MPGPATPAMIATLTEVGAQALLDVQTGGPAVVLVAAAIGSAARATTGLEEDLFDLVAQGPIASSQVIAPDRRIDLGLLFEGAELAADHPVREIGVFDDQDRLIFYWSTAVGSVGSITPRSDYAAVFSVTLETAPLDAIAVTDLGLPFELFHEPRIVRLERRSRRNLFLALS